MRRTEASNGGFNGGKLNVLPVAFCLEWSTLARGAGELSAEGIAGTVASLGIFRVIAEISVTTRGNDGRPNQRA